MLNPFVSYSKSSLISCLFLNCDREEYRPFPLLDLIFEILEIYITSIGLHPPKLGSEREMMCNACPTSDTPLPC